MNKEQIIRAWKNETYRASLTAAQLAELPHNPAGVAELGAEELDAAAGGYDTERLLTFGCCRSLLSLLFSCGLDCTTNDTFNYNCK